MTYHSLECQLSSEKINGTAIANPWDEKDLILASSHLVRRSDRAQELLDPRSAGILHTFYNPVIERLIAI